MIIRSTAENSWKRFFPRFFSNGIISLTKKQTSQQKLTDKPIEPKTVDSNKNLIEQVLHSIICLLFPRTIANKDSYVNFTSLLLFLPREDALREAFLIPVPRDKIDSRLFWYLSKWGSDLASMTPQTFPRFAVERRGRPVEIRDVEAERFFRVVTILFVTFVRGTLCWRNHARYAMSFRGTDFGICFREN